MTREEREAVLASTIVHCEALANLVAVYRQEIAWLQNSLVLLPNDEPWPRGQRIA